jgi:nucleotide-binding universal stress UspA family protein
MYKRMLVPLDGSEVAEIVFPYAKELAGRLNLETVFLHVCGPHESDLLPLYRAYVEHTADIMRLRLRQVRGKKGFSSDDKAVEARGEVAVGHPAEGILHYADKNHIDLILMATHGRSGIRRWDIGSVADKVLRASSVPVWLVRAGLSEGTIFDKGQKMTILVPLDGSELAESVLPYVETLAERLGVEPVSVILLMACEPLDMPPIYDREASFDWGKLVEEHIVYSRQLAERYLAGVARRLEDAGLRVTSEVVEGEPADEIINCASRNPFSLIVMSSHGRSGLSRWVYGSVADKLIHGVSGPVLLVRPR